MKATPEELYQIYQEASTDMNVEIDRWSDLEDLLRDVWTRFAERINEEYPDNVSQQVSLP